MKKIFLLLAIGYLLFAAPVLAQALSPEEKTATPPGRAQEIKERVQERIQQLTKAKKGAFWGTLTQITNTTLILEGPRGERRVKTDEETKFLVGKKEGKLAELEIGNFIIAMGFREKNGTLTAKRVVALAKPPTPPIRPQAVYGKVTDISEEEKILVLTHLKKGTTFEVRVTASTIISKKVEGPPARVKLAAIEIGDRVTAVGSKEKVGEILTAKILHVIPGKTKSLEKITPTPAKLTPTPVE